ncbi:MAG: inorganic diphosphatase [Candidatus Shapirobacteria bacterium]|nr:inorganic diphosphatase [Candidatus Shapirobacteria bacterium]
MIQLVPNNKKSPQIVNAIIEIPQGSHNKYEFDEELNVIKLDRVLHSPFFYPVDYGFIPETRAADGDHMDIMVITDSPVFPGCLMEARPIGLFIMADEKGDDEKVLAVPAKNPNFAHIKDVNDVSPHLLKSIVHFFSEYKRLEEKDVVIKGWRSLEDAYSMIEESSKTYQEEGEAISELKR